MSPLLKYFDGLPEIDDSILLEYDTLNTIREEQLLEKVRDAEQNLGESEVSEALRAVADHYSTIGDKAPSFTTINACDRQRP